jgi:hypothetical protein
MSVQAMVVERNGDKWLHWADEVEDTGEIRPGIVRHAAEGWFSRGVRNVRQHGVRATLVKAWSKWPVGIIRHRETVVSDDATQFNGNQRLEDMDTPSIPLPHYHTYVAASWNPEPIEPGTHWQHRLAIETGHTETVPVIPGRPVVPGVHGTRIIDQVSGDLTELLNAVKQAEAANAEAHPPVGHKGTRRMGWRAEAQGAGATLAANLADPEWHTAARRTAVTVAAWAATTTVVTCSAVVVKAAFAVMF